MRGKGRLQAGADAVEVIGDELHRRGLAADRLGLQWKQREAGRGYAIDASSIFVEAWVARLNDAQLWFLASRHWHQGDRHGRRDQLGLLRTARPPA